MKFPSSPYASNRDGRASVGSDNSLKERNKKRKGLDEDKNKRAKSKSIIFEQKHRRKISQLSLNDQI